MTPNVEALYKAYKHIEAHPEQWDQNNFGPNAEKKCILGWAMYFNKNELITPAREIYASLGLKTNIGRELFTAGQDIDVIAELLNQVEGYAEYAAAQEEPPAPKFELGQEVYYKGVKNRITDLHMYLSGATHIGLENGNVVYDLSEISLNPGPLTAREAVRVLQQYEGGLIESMQAVLDAAKERGIA